MRRILGCWQGFFLKKRPVFWKASDPTSRPVSNPKWTFRGFSQKYSFSSEAHICGPQVSGAVAQTGDVVDINEAYTAE
jgi:hypothetical protein